MKIKKENGMTWMFIVAVVTLLVLQMILLAKIVTADDETEIEESQEIRYEADEELEEQLMGNFLENQGLESYSCEVETENGDVVYFHYFIEAATKPATCEEPGYVDRVCSVCGEHEHIEIPKIDHFYENGVCVMCGKYEDGLEKETEIIEADIENENNFEIEENGEAGETEGEN